MEKLEITRKVEEVIEQIRPYLQEDGGDIDLIEITDDFIVKVNLKGSCSSCPYSLMTLKNSVEEAIKKFVPEIKEVVGV